MRLGRYPFIVILHPDRDGFTSPAPRIGAWFVIDAAAIRGCPPTGGLRT